MQSHPRSHPRSTLTVAEAFLRERAERAETPGASRRVFTRAEATALADAVVQMTSNPNLGATITHHAVAVTTIVRNDRLKCVDSDHLTLRIGTRLGCNIYVGVETSIRDLTLLQQVIKRTEMQVAPVIQSEDTPLSAADDPVKSFLGPRTYLPVELWHDTTIDAMEHQRGVVLAQMIEQFRTANLLGAASLAVCARAEIHRYTAGRTAWGESTDSEITATARMMDGTASGWSGEAHRDWTKLDGVRVARQAIAMANRNRGAVRLEPGRYTAILGPAAVGALVVQMSPLFEAVRIDGGSGPYGIPRTPDGRENRLGQRVADPRITMWTDHNDPDGGDYPFFPDDGFPSGNNTWIKNGVLTALAYDVEYGMRRGKTPYKAPTAIRMSGGTTSIEEMIATCDRGIYVNRFSGVEVVDGPSGSMTGTTRDGCFFIKDGKIKTPVTNFRIYQSPFLSLNNVMALGVPQRVAFGFMPPHGGGHFGEAVDRWPLDPVIVPPLMVHDFNFSALCDAI